MSKPIVNGKKPLPSSKKALQHDDLFGNMLSISPDIQAELDAKGLVGRWVSASKLYAAGGYHPKGWVVYKSDSIKTEFKFGNDPDGIIRRGDSVLAVKSKEKADQHREFLKQKAARQTNTQAMAASELRSAMAKTGLNAKVYDGYDGEDE